ncbi:unnamed protein product [Linum trigynum]|uniref:Gnk2-homologous domain-containing protein n=1 Tax=Linum trigynum TaxID=586398 RepID=A0AAV2CME6_9ROSI
MAVQVGPLEARMATVLMFLLILTTINGGFNGGVMIISARDPMCGASDEWFCSPNDSAHPDIKVQLTPSTACQPFYSSSGDVPDGYVHSSCADAYVANSKCDDCLKTATEVISDHCYGKDGAQYGTEHCCVRYEKEKFC